MNPPKSNLCHIILTRFNLPSGGRESKIRNSPNWLENRFELFETYCLPSVMQQSNADFKWFIYFDRDTPEPFRTRVKQYEIQYRQITIFWGKNIPLADIQKQIFERAPEHKEYLLTTRLDNDDALNKDFVSKLQTAAAPLSNKSNALVMNYQNGLILCGDRVYSHHDTSNPFASVLEPLSANIKTIWQHQHTKLHNFGTIHQLNSQAMWLQVIHKHNVSNRIRGYRVQNIVLVNAFPFIKRQLVHEHYWLILLENATLTPVRKIKEFFRSKLKTLLVLIRSND
ncbi:glycosyltransferase [Arenicella xantha]|uniref:Putative rhamnosyltransferase n=1 Tax=Arenicella xantha TaxID=644221 RepID=A0A395JTM7_9GAMM|nr:glycosyltransferase [Arenicella xantha]RBP52938.1 putative rhamnosyltransferase [Arenicella xantha]